MNTRIKAEVTLRISDEDWERLKKGKFVHNINGIRIIVKRVSQSEESFGQEDGDS